MSTETAVDTTVLRDAAAQMRHRAINATGLNWNSDNGEAVYTVDTDEPRPTTVARSAKPADIAHIAGWGPATALALADWLDSAADRGEAAGITGALDEPHALAVARAYLDSGWDGDPYPM